MNAKSSLATDVRTAIKMLRILRHDVRVQLELARIAPSDEWRNLEMQLRDLETGIGHGSEPARAVVVEAARKLEKFRESLPLKDGLRLCHRPAEGRVRQPRRRDGTHRRRSRHNKLKMSQPTRNGGS